MIAGFEQPDRGEIWLHGNEVSSAGPHKRDVNMVFQGYALFPHLTVWHNIAFGLRRRKVGRSEIASRVNAAIEMVGLGDRATRMPRELSGGQQQRVALARALVNRPRALLLDEPLGALDLQLRQSMQMELKRIQREAGITFVYVTHDQGEALTMSDRVAVMNGGRIEQCGDPKTIYQNPATQFVAGFIGTSNLIRGRSVRLVGDELVLDTAEGDLVMVPATAGHRVGDEVTFSVRPEKVMISVQQPETGNRLAGRIADTVYLGVSTSYVVDTGQLKGLVVFEKNGSTTESYERGQEVWLSWDMDSSRTFASS
jgi:spermidine/putrescine transport system ATP-binding protein